MFALTEFATAIYDNLMVCIGYPFVPITKKIIPTYAGCLLRERGTLPTVPERICLFEGVICPEQLE
jgi:hypothetical protein